MDDLNVRPLEGFEPTSKDGKAIVPALAAFFQNWQHHLSEQFTKMQKEFEDICVANATKIQNLEDKVRTLEKKLEKVELQTEDQLAAELQDTIILSGNGLPSVSVNERCGQVAKDVIRTKLSINLHDDDIVAAYRIGKKVNDNTPDKRKILVRLTKKLQKNDLISAAKTAKPDDLFVSENLTPTRQKIAYALRQAKKNFPNIVSGTNTMNGVPYVWIKPTGRATGGASTRHKIVSHATLKRFYSDTLDTPLEEVVNDFSE